MKIFSLITLAFAGTLASCSLFDPDYAEYKRQKEAAASPASDVPPLTPFSNPNIPAETGTYTPSGGYDNSQPYYGDDSSSGNYTPSGGGQTSSHKVVKGDTLWGISRKYNVGVEAIKAANGLTGDTIVVGRSLTIPAR